MLHQSVLHNSAAHEVSLVLELAVLLVSEAVLSVSEAVLSVSEAVLLEEVVLVVVVPTEQSFGAEKWGLFTRELGLSTTSA